MRSRSLAASLLLVVGWWGGVASIATAGTIDTQFLEQPWPRQTTRTFEVGKYAVRWRQRLDRQEGIFAGVVFNAPTDRQTTWRLATEDYVDVGHLAPGVTSVRYLERTPTRQVIEIDVKVLWKRLRLTFEVEQEPPTVVRFRLVNETLGEYRGLFRLLPDQDLATPHTTPVELATWLKPSRPVPMRLLAVVQRIVFLTGVKQFMETCEHPPPPASVKTVAGSGGT